MRRCLLRLGLIFLGFAGAMPGTIHGQLELIPDKETQSVFAGNARPISVTIRNAGVQKFDDEIHAWIYQASSATAVLICKTNWKRLEIPAGETVLESAALDFPPVREQTKFLIQWLRATNHVIGTSEVRVYPTNLLERLQPWARDRSLGVFDPMNRLKPLLRNSGVDYVDLGNSELEHFPGRLAIVGPFASKAQVPEGLAGRIKILARKGVGVVWILPEDSSKELQPSFYLAPEGSGMVVVAQAAMVPHLSADPRSQLNLLYLCGLALRPRFFTLPDISPRL